MSITKVGISTISPELLEYIQDALRNYLGWDDLSDVPVLAGSSGKYLGSEIVGGDTTLTWKDFPSFGLEWTTATTDVSALDKVGYLASGGITITLPNNPAIGTLVAIADRFGVFNEEPVTVVPSGLDTIEDESSLIIDLKNAFVQLIFAENKWEITQVNHPYNISEITEESYPAGNNSYLLSRVPPSRESLLIVRNGLVVPTSEYSVTANTLIFGSVQNSEIRVRHIGVAGATKVADAPVGMIGLYPHNVLPDGWLYCRGQTITRSVYPELVDYLTKGSGADTVSLPDYGGDFLQIWDSSDTIGANPLPAVLSDGKLGRWLDTTESASTVNLWDNDTATSTYVKFSDKYIGYQFDAPVGITQVQIHTDEDQGPSYIPTSIRLEYSDNGIVWSAASISATGGSAINNIWFSITSTEAAPHKFWRVKGTGGNSYPGSDYYWRVSACVFSGVTSTKYVGEHRDEVVKAHGHPTLTDGVNTYSIDVVQAGLPVGSDYRVAVLSLDGTDPAVTTPLTITDNTGSRNLPNHSTVVAAIKAFSYQGGSLTTSEVSALRDEVAQLRALIEV